MESSSCHSTKYSPLARRIAVTPRAVNAPPPSRSSPQFGAGTTMMRAIIWTGFFRQDHGRGREHQNDPQHRESV